ncbi:hypothetical protein [Dyadobacter sp. Leaf189]|uniref:hypothetical protein n=1 Tax=Dyadobacter sp. Leaf189 TaxID=1736295 RepID=UPI000A9D1215|nr:hypothetical protein [Dyadobacter sp. Leaf189]
MKTRVFTLKKTATALCLFLSIFLMAFSCDDHVVPEEPTEEPVTAFTSTSAGLAFNLVIYNYTFGSLGMVPVMEHGIVRVNADVNSVGILPTVDDKKIISNEAAAVKIFGVFEVVTPELKKIYYRPYAILENGNVIYGNVNSIISNP